MSTEPLDYGVTLAETDGSDPISQAFTTGRHDPRGLEIHNVADGLFAIAKSLDRVAAALVALGNGNASTQMGAIEAHGLAVKETGQAIAGAIAELAERVP